MQVPQAESSQNKRVGVEEQFIKFKSSQNFKVMKKFIRSKIDNTEKSNRSSPNNLPDPPTPPSAELCAGAAPEPGSPDTPDAPPEPAPAPAPSPPSDRLERKDRDTPTMSEVPEGFPREEPKGAEPGGEEGAIMCRDFVRGTCKRVGTCRYAHKCDTSQLVGVYTFCRNFQNKVCTRPNCKYVHGSIFEEQSFYRTGKLPPNVLVPKSALPSPPPPTAEPRVEIPTSFATPPPPLPIGLEATSPMYLPTNTTEPRSYRDKFGNAVPPPRDSAEEPPLKKCKFCSLMDIRARCHATTLGKKRDTVEEWKRKTTDMEEKKEKMSAIIMGLLNITRNPSTAAGPSSLFNIVGGDKNKMLLEQLAKLNSSNRLSTIGEDTCKGLLNDSMRSESYGIMGLLAKLLSEYQRQGPALARAE